MATPKLLVRSRPKSLTCTTTRCEQDATALWYHDHAMGLTRLNTYAGLFGMLLLRDAAEDALAPALRQVREFRSSSTIATSPPTGQLFYDVSGDPESPWIPEFSADGILINGKVRPFLDVEPRLYRFRLLNT